jgi:hypothetical protein
MRRLVFDLACFAFAAAEFLLRAEIFANRV